MLENALKEAFKNKVNLRFSDIKDIPGIFNTETSESINMRVIKNNFNNALKGFIDSRLKEGKKIENVLLKKIKAIEKISQSIQNKEKKSLNKRIKNYQNKIKKLTQDFDETRLDQEVAMLALKHDIAEELDIKPTVLNKAIKIAYKNSLSEERDAFDDMEMILDTIKRGGPHKEE